MIGELVNVFLRFGVVILIFVVVVILLIWLKWNFGFLILLRGFGFRSVWILVIIVLFFLLIIIVLFFFRVLL